MRSGLLGGLMASYLGYAWQLEVTGLPETLLQNLLRCPFLQITGRPCPICGTTRSWHAALHGDWSEAFEHHPVAPLVLPLAVGATAAFLAHFVSPTASRNAGIGKVLEW